MIASERSLTSAHQSQQQRKTVTLVKSRNGATKPPIRPVKIYVIDPRKLQQRLEAYVDQKNQKRAEAEAERERQDNGAQKEETEKCDRPLTDQQALSLTTSLPANKPSTTSTVRPAKVLSTLAPKPPPITPIPNITSISMNNHETTVLGNGTVTLPCINGTTLNLPTLPLVVTNGVALIQPPISQSSIPTSGLFLPGVTAIPSVVSNDGSLIGASQPQQLHQIKAKQRYNSTTQKRKIKKKKAAKKRKLAERKEKDEDDDDGELSYLLKETTTRLGRISRPVSQPHSPLVATTLSAASSRAPSPKLKRKAPINEDITLQCEGCIQVFANQEILEHHYEEFPLHRKGSISILPQQSLHSTNINVQSPILSPIPFPMSHKGATETTTNFSTTDKAILQSTTKNTSISSTGVNDTAKRFALSDNTDKVCSATNFNSFHRNAERSFKTVSENAYQETLTGNAHLVCGIGESYERQSISNRNMSVVNETEVNTLVPTAEEHNGLFQHSNVVQVPSSYSLPSSPPSRCQSPGSLDDVFNTNLLSKRGAPSPVATCSSPVDPMLLHSRSPFPPPIPENSSHSVGASNLSIPEESLCKGELFMDLGGGALENTSLSTISPTPFGNNDSEIGQLFIESAMKEPTQVTQESETQSEEVVPVDEEKRDSKSASGSSVVTPMLLETTEDANDGEIFQTANYTRTFLHPSVISSAHMPPSDGACEDRSVNGRTFHNGSTESPRTPPSACLESDVSMDSSETFESNNPTNQKCRSIWQFVKDQIKSRGISQACGEISEMADKLSRIARDHFIPIREEEIERSGNSASIIHVDTPFFSHLLDLPFGMYVFKEELGTRKRPTPPPMTSSELSFTGGVEDVEKFLPPDIDLISLPHLTNLDLT